MTDETSLYGSEELETLIRDDTVFTGVFECMGRIWRSEGSLKDRNLGSSEYRTRLLEKELADLYPPLYDDLVDEIEEQEHPLMEMEDGCGLIMDALSLREGFRLKEDLGEEHDWEVSLSWAPIERLPSETKFICRAWFDAQAPSAVSRDDFRYIGDMNVPQLPGTSPEFVWSRFPDKRLEQAMGGNYAVEEVEDIYEDVKGLVEDIVRESVHEDFLVTSDHGYVNFLGNNPYALTDDQEDAISGKFSGRSCEVDNSYELQRLEEAGVIERTGDHCVVKGHYSWTQRGASPKVRHGGLSLIECMTPVLRINTGGN
jgi:hypothetical protein